MSTPQQRLLRNRNLAAITTLVSLAITLGSFLVIINRVPGLAEWMPFIAAPALLAMITGVFFTGAISLQMLMETERHGGIPAPIRTDDASFGAEQPVTRASTDASPNSASAVIRTDCAAKPVGAYPHARRVGELLYLSGIGPRRPGGNEIPGNHYTSDGRLASYDIDAQWHSTLANVEAVLKACGASIDDLIDVTVYLTDLPRDFARYNQLWAERFSADRGPCRTTLGISHLPTPIAIELKCVARITSPAPSA